ncbi:MAG: hypothetical protein ACKO04_01315 [Actinomycetes bacterium]
MAPAPRPFGITLLMTLGVISGALNVLAGIFVALDRNSASLLKYAFSTPNQLLVMGLFVIALGALQAALALALGGGSNAVRILFAVIAVLNLGAGIWALVALHSEQRAGGAFSACVSLVVLYLLFNHRAEEYFESNQA